MSVKNRLATRRAVVAGFAASPLAALPPDASGGLSDDPIFAAFAEFERAKTANEAISKAVDDLRGETFAAIKAVGLDPREICSLRKLKTCLEMEVYSEEDYAAGLAKLEGSPGEIQKALIRLDEAEDADVAASRAAWSSERKLCETPPTTRAGALRLLRHLADFLDEDDVVNDNWVGDTIGDAIRNAVAVLEREARS